MPASGWIKLHRKVMENGIWDDKPFAQGQAWIDLLMLANYENKEVWFDGEIFLVSRGSFITSLRKLAEKWGWSRAKVKRFLNKLETLQMATIKCDTKKTTVTILNYDEYQGSDDDLDEAQRATKRATKKPQASHNRATDEPQTNTTKNLKNSKKQRKKEAAPPVPSKEVPAAAEDDDDMMLPDDIVWDDPTQMTEEEAERWIHSGHV